MFYIFADEESETIHIPSAHQIKCFQTYKIHIHTYENVHILMRDRHQKQQWCYHKHFGMCNVCDYTETADVMSIGHSMCFLYPLLFQEYIHKYIDIYESTTGSYSYSTRRVIVCIVKTW